MPRALIETTLVLLVVAIFAASLLLGEGREATLSTLGVFAYVGLRLQPALQSTVSNLNHLRFGTALLDDLIADHDRVEPVLAADAHRRAQPGEVTRFTDTIGCHGVGFAYPGGATAAVTDVDLTIRRGEFVGICGPTGGGKSTLVDLLVGLLGPTAGRVTVDGQDLAGREAWWQAQLGVVSQDVFLIDDTLRANIALGEHRDDIDEAAVARAVSRAQLDAWVASLPEGLDTPVGERGVRLSGGQRQRVAIARALYRDPAVVVFDEGTSALDAATEAAVVGALEDLRADRTLIAVAHRISTIRHADRILLIHQGRLAASGTYASLLRDHAGFRALAATDAERS